VTRFRLSSWDAALLLLVVMILLSAAVGYGGESAARSAKPGVPVLTVGPRMAMSGGSGLAVIRVRVEIPRPTPEMFCPRVELTVIGRPLCDARQETEGGRAACDDYVEGVEAFHEVQEADCPPWSDEEVVVVSPPPPQGDGGGWFPATRDVPFVWPYIGQKRIGMGPGEWTVRVVVTQGKTRFVLEGRTTVH